MFRRRNHQHQPSSSQRLRLCTVLTVIPLAAAFIGIGAFTNAPKADGCAVPTGIAHRGGYLDSSTRTENTLKAYETAAASGVMAWEADIRYSAGGGAFLMHDATIDRTTTGTGPASSVAIDSTTVKMNDGQALKDQKLSRLLSLARANGATLAIEPKILSTEAQARYVVGFIDYYDMRDRVILDSFYPANLAPFKAVIVAVMS